VSRILGLSRKKVQFIESLARGTFVFYTGERIEKIQFPRFEGYGKAYEVKREIVKRKSRGLWQRLKEAFSKESNDVEEKLAREEGYSDFEEYENEEDEDLLLFQEE